MTVQAEARDSSEMPSGLRSANMNLSAKDLDMFSSLCISVELLIDAGIERVTDAEARGKYGITGYGDMAGIVFPYIDPLSGRRVTARIRRDHPEMEGDKVKRKYVYPYGDRRHLYFPPGSRELLDWRP